MITTETTITGCVDCGTPVQWDTSNEAWYATDRELGYDADGVTRFDCQDMSRFHNGYASHRTLATCTHCGQPFHVTHLVTSHDCDA